jgi:putative restriction endonuclease
LRFWVGVTDNSWFEFLAGLLPDEVNFWQPSGRTSFKAIEPGELFLFKLHYPFNFIAGGGFFVRHSIIPLSLAWEAFEQKNGAVNFEDFRSKIMRFRRQREIDPDPLIGCIILTDPFFLSRSEWIPVPDNWSSNIVQGKTYNTNDSFGAMLWARVQERLVRNKSPYTSKEELHQEVLAVSEDRALYGLEYLTRARLGQGTFRILVTEAYKRRCAITGERTLPVLESAHIKPYSRSGPHKISNGILLRSDLHKLYDLGYLAITEDFNVEVSKRIKEEYENGRDYYALHGKRLINLPENSFHFPSKEYLEWHNKEIYFP